MQKSNEIEERKRNRSQSIGKRKSRPQSPAQWSGDDMHGSDPKKISTEDVHTPRVTIVGTQKLNDVLQDVTLDPVSQAAQISEVAQTSGVSKT